MKTVQLIENRFGQRTFKYEFQPHITGNVKFVCLNWVEIILFVSSNSALAVNTE